MKIQALKLSSLLGIALALALFAPQRAAADDEDDPPSRVARLSYTHGSVSFNPAGTDDWVSAVVNRPITTGDKLWTDNGARAELHIGSAAIRLSGNTGFSFLNLTDNISQIRITEGTINIRVRSLDEDEIFEVDTPNLAFSILRPGRYRLSVNDEGDTTVVGVREGQGEVTGGGSAYTMHSRETGTFAGIEQLDADIQNYYQDEDDFDRWCADRDRHADRSVSARYVSTDVIGYDDLDDYGGWRPVPEYGTVWFPHTVIVGWAPYRFGHWVWISPWGWTWVDDAPWGFAPFHYGRWIVVGGLWGWVPSSPRHVVGVAYVRPVYAPALVAWVGGPHWGIGVSVGGVAWFPLGPRDVYCPSYRVSPRYVENVNISNTTVINRTYVTNVYNNVYVNKTVNVTNIKYQNQTAPNAVTATSHQAFTSAQPVGRHMMRIDAREAASAPVAPLTPSVAPQQRSVLGAGGESRVRPPATLGSRPVVAKTTPPPAPVPFARQQQAIQAQGGRPLATSEVRQIQREHPPEARSNIRIAPPVQPGKPREVQPRKPAVTPPVVPAKPADRPANIPPATGRPKAYEDRPPVARPNVPGESNPRLEQRQQQQFEQLRQKQDQERQRIERQQEQDRRKPAQKDAGEQRQEQRQQQVDQRHQQQLEQMERKHDQDQQKLQQKQQQERQKQVKPPPPKPPQPQPPKEKDDRPPHRG